jgi:hypothetical protein
MHTNKKLVAVGVVAAGSLAVTGIGVSVAASSAGTHTLKVTSTEILSKNLPKNQFLDTDKDTSNGKYVGSDVVIGVYDPKTQGVKARVAFALSGGIMYANFSVNAKTGALTGKLTGGSGKFKDVSGTITGTPVSKKATAVTVIYSR